MATTLNDPLVKAGSISGGTVATGINDSGQIVGYYGEFPTHGFLYDPALPQPYTTLDDPLGFSGTLAAGINDLGQIVGSYSNGAGNFGFLYNPALAQPYTTLGGPLATITLTAGGTFATGINDSGQIVGYYFDGSGTKHGFLYDPALPQPYTTLDDPLATSGTQAAGINNSGQIVGTYVDGSNILHGFLYNPALAQPYTTLGVAATGINDSGQIVGSYVDGSGTHGLLYNPALAQPYTTVDDPQATNGSQLRGINDSGQVVGVYDDGSGRHGFFATLSATLFTSGNDSVDFNAITPDRQAAIAAGADIYHGLGGNDVVTLPNLANYNESVGNGKTLNWDPAQTFLPGTRAGDVYKITGGDGSDNIQLGAGNDTVYGSPGNDIITGGAGQDTFDYQKKDYPPQSNQAFGDFNGFGPGALQTITGKHSTFATAPTQQNVLRLPGSPSDYSFRVSFSNDTLPGTTTQVSTTAGSGFPIVILQTTDVEAARFDKPIGNPVSLSSPHAGGTAGSDMIRLAREVYGPLETLSHSAEALAFPNTSGLFHYPYASDALGQSTVTQAAVAPGPEGDNWQPVSAMQLGMAPADFGQWNTLKYSFENGFYAAIDTSDKVPLPLIPFLGNDYPEADAMVLTGIVNGQTTLAIAFRGTDQLADFADYPSFATYYAKYKPLVDAIKAYVSDPGNKISQVLISGHSLGAGAAQYLVNELESTSPTYSILAYTDGSPGSENPTAGLPINNFVQIGDPVALVPTLTTTAAKALIGIILTAAGGLGAAAAGLLSGIQTKTRVGTDILIDDGGSWNPIELTRQGVFTYHYAGLYADNLALLSSFALDPSSPFCKSQVGLSLANNTLCTFKASYSNPYGPGAVDGNEIAVSRAIQNAAGKPVPGPIVYVNPSDNYVLGSIVFWDMPASGEPVHVVDGGPSAYTAVDFLGTSNNYATVSTITNIGTDSQIYYFPNGEPANADPTSGQLIGDLYRVGHISYVGGYVASVSSSQTGAIHTGQIVQLTLAMSGPVTLNTTGGSPTLTLADPVTASYDTLVSNPASGTLVFDYSAGSGDKFGNLQVTSVNLNGAVVQGIGGANVDFSAALNIPIGLSVNSPLVVTSVSSSQTGVLGVGQTDQLTLTLSEGMTVNTSGGLPTLTLNDGAAATYDGAASNPTTGTLVFDYSVQPGDATQNLAISHVNLSIGTTVQDANGNNADFSAALNVGTGVQVGAPGVPASVTQLSISPGTGDQGVGNAITLTLALSGAVTVTGSPTLTLNDSGTAIYDAAKSTSTSLVFDYAVAASDVDVPSLAITQVNLDGGTIRDGAGNDASLSLSGLSQSGPPIDTDTREQAALSLKVNGGSAIGNATASAVSFTVGGLEADDNGTVSFSDGSHVPVVVNITNGVAAATTANLAGLSDGTITGTLHLNNDAAGNSFTDVVVDVQINKTPQTGQLSGQISLASATEGIAVAGTTTVATFVDTDTGEPATAFTATINWGDGTTTIGSVSGANGSFTVSDGHTYADEGSDTAVVTITRTADGTQIAPSGTVTVADAALSATGTTVSGTEGTAISDTPVATFTDANPNATASDFSATINWGDGTSTAGTVVAQNGGGLAVDGGHTYADEGQYTVGVTINDVGGSTASAPSTASVADAALSATGTTVSGTEGTAISDTPVATFTDANPNATASDFTATIDWGDGTTATGTVVAQNGGGFAVDGGHTYADEGQYTVGVTINDVGGSTASAPSTASVADAALSATGTTVSGTEGTAISDTPVATFTDANPNATASDFTATIDWGDGTTATGTVVAQNGGGFAVDGGHTYADEGQYTTGVSINDVGGSTASAASTASVADAALSATGTTVSGTEGAAISDTTVATFTDANPNATASDFTATIDWGDGTSTSGTVIAQNGGGFAVDGDHTYTDEGNFNIGVTINDVGGSTTSAASTASIADAALSATGTTVNGIEGTAISGATVATFTDANPNAAASDFSATINWGDGTSTAGTVVAYGGGLAVDGGHTYADEGQYTVGVTINDVGGSAASANSSASIADATLSATGTTLSGTEGTAISGATVATFTDANPNAAASDFSATIDWGDGTTTAGTVVAQNGGGFAVDGGHTYADEGQFNVGVTINDVGGSTTSASDTASVADAALSAVTVGGLSQTLFQSVPDLFFTPPNSDFVDDVAGNQQIFDTFTLGSNSLVTGITFDVSNQTQFFPNWTSEPLTLAIYNIAPSGGPGTKLFSATFTPDADAHINFNLSFATALVTYDTHLALNPGTYLITYYNQDGLGAMGFVNGGSDQAFAEHLSTGTISPVGESLGFSLNGEVIATGTTVSGTEGAAISDTTVATFTDANPNATASDFTATIDWGDGTSTSGTVIAQNGGGFAVDGDHTYTDEGNFNIGVTINDVGGSTTSAASTASIADAALSATGTTVSGTEGAAISGATVAIFTDANPNAAASDFTASINWGDGTSTTGTVVAQNGGGFAVDGGHTYADEGQYTVGVTINDVGSSTASAPTTASVADADVLTLQASRIKAEKNEPLSNVVVASFTDPHKSNVAADFGATINWGDGTTTAGTVAGADGAFTVSGTHTYTKTGRDWVTVAVTDDASGSANATAVGRVTVSGRQDEPSINEGKDLKDGFGFAEEHFGAHATLGYSSDEKSMGAVGDCTDAAKLALLGQFAASSFVTTGTGHGGTLITDPQPEQQSWLAHPHS